MADDISPVHAYNKQNIIVLWFGGTDLIRYNKICFTGINRGYDDLYRFNAHFCHYNNEITSKSSSSCH